MLGISFLENNDSKQKINKTTNLKIVIQKNNKKLQIKNKQNKRKHRQQSVLSDDEDFQEIIVNNFQQSSNESEQEINISDDEKKKIYNGFLTNDSLSTSNDLDNDDLGNAFEEKYNESTNINSNTKPNCNSD